MNFLVTGGAGFIGSHVCERLLQAGHAVWAFDDLNPFYDPQIKRANLRSIQSLAKPFEFTQADLTDAAAVNERRRATVLAMDFRPGTGKPRKAKKRPA